MDVQRGTRVIGILVPSSSDLDLSATIRQAIAFHGRGADIVDLDMLPGGPFAGIDEDAVALLVRGLGEAGIPASVTTTDASVARIALAHGVRWIIDPSGTTADPEMFSVARRPSLAGWIIGPWSPRLVAERGIDAYNEGLVRNLAALLEAGVHSDRIVLNASAGLSATASDPWRMLNHLDRIKALGYPILIDARDELLASMSSDDSAARLEDAAVGLAVLAAGVGAWGIRTRGAERVAGAVQRILEPRRSA
ncbi:MAG TPA: dihydropteroate synthase [Microbacteriaceae bacterium]|nr:dihydropteroate synthase [Microbacteriaceae bacterium]